MRRPADLGLEGEPRVPRWDDRHTLEAAIGGAGTFDGVFLTGIVAVRLT